MPLEGLWWAADMSAFSIDDKSAWDWTMLIMQPEEVTADVLVEAKAKAAAKVPVAALERLRLERFGEGLAAQALHIGPYSAEGPTIASLHAFIAEQGHELVGNHTRSISAIRVVRRRRSSRRSSASRCGT
jgi:hypothetical protein